MKVEDHPLWGYYLNLAEKSMEEKRARRASTNLASAASSEVKNGEIGDKNKKPVEVQQGASSSQQKGAAPFDAMDILELSWSDNDNEDDPDFELESEESSLSDCEMDWSDMGSTTSSDDELFIKADVKVDGKPKNRVPTRKHLKRKKPRGFKNSSLILCHHFRRR